MKICCEDFKELLKSANRDKYKSIMIMFNPESDNQFSLTFHEKSKYGESWKYLKYCPFCGEEIKNG